MEKDLISLLLAMIIISVGCRKEVFKQETKRILHIAHTRSATNGVIDDKLKGIDFAAFDVLCLGGDIDVHTSREDTIMAKWDERFDFGKESTLWTLGNHDIDDRILVEKYTKRPSFYSWNYESITFLVLDDQIDRTNIIGEQLALVETLADTLQASNYLIVLTHNLLWMYGNETLEPLVEGVPNGGIGNCSFCIKPNNFYEAVYPQLVKIREKGIEVLCIAGDLGIKTNEFSYTTPENIHFLASGIDVTQDIDNQSLMLELSMNGTELNWFYKVLEDL